ncbi:MAG: V-type ATP synthase subunit E family protein [Acidilobaceae archaeon]
MSLSKRLIGDPLGLARKSGIPELEKSKNNLDEALSAGDTLLLDAFKSMLIEYEQRLQVEYSSVRDFLKGVRARLETETRIKIAQKKKDFVNKVLNEVKARIAASRNEEWYREFMYKIFVKLAEEAKTVGVLTVWVSKDDQSLAKELVEKLGTPLLRIAPEPAYIVGGAIAKSESGLVNIDLSVDTILSIIAPKLQVLILKSLGED